MHKGKSSTELFWRKEWGRKNLVKVFLILGVVSLSGCLTPPRPFHVQAITVNREPVENATVKVESSVGPIKGKTNQEGVQTFFWFFPDIFDIEVSKEGFYTTYTEGFYRSKARVPVRPKINPALTLDKEVFVDLPAKEHVFYYDVIEADLVEPYGEGTHKDFRFDIKVYMRDSEYQDEKFPAIKATFEAVGKNNGFIPLFIPRTRRPHSFRFPYRAPMSGYFPSIALAHENAPRDEDGDVMTWIWNERKYIDWGDTVDKSYIFRVRSGSDKGPIYGRVYEYRGFGTHGDDAGYVDFSYRINLERTRSLEVEKTISHVEGTAPDPEDKRGRPLPTINLNADDTNEDAE